MWKKSSDTFVANPPSYALWCVKQGRIRAFLGLPLAGRA
jgi:hypothetical protein